MIIVVAYGKILPPWLLALPKFGCVNLHGSLLPKYRGAAPVHWAIANGETSTGVCTMQLDEGLDTGPVFLSERTSIDPEETVTELSGRLAEMGSDLVERTVDGIVNGTLTPVPQDGTLATLAPILKKHHGWMDWQRSALSIHNQVRAFNPWPGTTTRFRGTMCKVLKTRQAGQAESGMQPGAIMASKRTLDVCCGDSMLLELIEVQPENRKAVSGSEFVNGFHIQSGERFDPIGDN
jgi:methionyl-tRNA formyltransferase